MKDSICVLYERKYKTKMCNTALEANKFMRDNPEYGILNYCVSELNEVQYHMAKLKDKGEKV